MTNPRAGIFAAFRAAKPDIFNDTGNILALDNLCDGYGIGRAEVTPAPAAGGLHQLSDVEAFYARVRRVTGALDQVQVDTIGALLGASAHWPLGWAAYGFATGWHEARLRPIKEIGGDAYFKRMYDIEGERPAKARELGNLTPGDGVR
jgi:hypothetical protein